MIQALNSISITDYKNAVLLKSSACVRENGATDWAQSENSPKNTAIPHLSKRRTSLDLPVRTTKKSGRVEEQRQRAATSISEQLLYHYPWCRTRRTSHVCAHRRLQRVPLNTRYTFKQSCMFNGVGLNCSHVHFACLRASNAATSTFEHSIYF